MYMRMFVRELSLVVFHLCRRHGLKNRFLSAIFRWYIRYRTTPKGYWAPIIEREEYWKNIGKITEISSIYWFGTDKSAKKLSVKWRVEQRKKLVKISKIYRRIYRRYIWEISKTFLKAFFFFKINIYHILFFNYSFLIYFLF